MRTLKTFYSIIPSDLKFVCSLVKDVLFYFNDTFGDLEECNQFEIKVVLNELILNAIKHGNKENVDKRVKLNAGITNRGYAYFIVEDEGDGCNYKSLIDCGQNTNDAIDYLDMRESGRGILIVKNFCENIKYSQRGNKVVILKKLQRA